jgi:hypothetical protein
LEIIPKEDMGETFEDALARVKRCIGGGKDSDNGDSDSDLEVVAESVTVNLRCPVRSGYSCILMSFLFHYLFIIDYNMH